MQTEAGFAEGVITYKQYVDGKWTYSQDGSFIDVVNPYTNRIWARVPDSGPKDVETAVRASHDAFESPEWKNMLPSDRAKLIYRFADLIEDDAEKIAMADTMSNGKLIREMLGQMKSVPKWYRYFAGVADKIFGEVIPLDNS